MDDLKDYLDDLTLVGGWMPYVYSKFLWNNIETNSVTTADIDFGFGHTQTKFYSTTIFKTLSSLNYTEHHYKIGKIYPVVLRKEGKIPVDFIACPEIADTLIEKFIGREIYINKIEKFDFLIENRNRISVILTNKPQKKYKIYCPKPSAFLYHKGITFIEREDEQKQAKDLYYMYFVLRYAPDIDTIFKDVIQYREKDYLINISTNLEKYFERISSRGCLMVEKENGPDEYIENLRQDIYSRFQKLQQILQKK
ncbi:MAG: GSU2403 family nucleotidyltransferase fold protein [Elusimicrobiota bacterium]